MCVMVSEAARCDGAGLYPRDWVLQPLIADLWVVWEAASDSFSLLNGWWVL